MYCGIGKTFAEGSTKDGDYVNIRKQRKECSSNGTTYKSPKLTSYINAGPTPWVVHIS